MEISRATGPVASAEGNPYIAPERNADSKAMSLNCGIVGLPNVGKSTLFNAITAASAAAENYPFCTIEPNVGIVPIPDPRLDTLASIYRSAKITPTVMEFVDIAGLVKGSSKGEGLGNQFLSHIREVHAICHVVRCFDDENVVHVDGSVNPKRDIEIVETELLLKDVETVEKKLSEAERRAKSGDKKIRIEVDYLARVREHLLGGHAAIDEKPATPDERTWLHDLHLLTAKPVMYIANVDESRLTEPNDYVDQVKAIAAGQRAQIVVACTKMEAEIASMPYAEREKLLQEIGVSESGLDQVIRGSFKLLDLITFFTCNPREARAWTLHRGATVLHAAGAVHTDFERGFIRAEVIKYDELAALGSEHAVKEKGHMRIEGREYVVHDGDVIFFRFNV